MKFRWTTEKIASSTFHYCYVGEMSCALVVDNEMARRKNSSGPGWQIRLPYHPYGPPGGNAASLRSAKALCEAEIEEWFERTKT